EEAEVRVLAPQGEELLPGSAAGERAPFAAAEPVGREERHALPHAGVPAPREEGGQLRAVLLHEHRHDVYLPAPVRGGPAERLDRGPRASGRAGRAALRVVARVGREVDRDADLREP